MARATAAVAALSVPSMAHGAAAAAASARTPGFYERPQNLQVDTDAALLRLYEQYYVHEVLFAPTWPSADERKRMLVALAERIARDYRYLMMHSLSAEQLMSRVSAAISRRYAQTLQHFDAQQKCVRCGSAFTWRGNIGAWRCRRHTGVRWRNDQPWPCCGFSHPGGCMPCDHEPARYDAQVRAVRVPLALVFELRNTQAEAIFHESDAQPHSDINSHLNTEMFDESELRLALAEHSGSHAVRALTCLVLTYDKAVEVAQTCMFTL